MAWISENHPSSSSPLCHGHLGWSQARLRATKSPPSSTSALLSSSDEHGYARNATNSFPSSASRVFSRPKIEATAPLCWPSLSRASSAILFFPHSVSGSAVAAPRLASCCCCSSNSSSTNGSAAAKTAAATAVITSTATTEITSVPAAVMTTEHPLPQPQSPLHFEFLPSPSWQWLCETHLSSFLFCVRL